MSDAPIPNANPGNLDHEPAIGSAHDAFGRPATTPSGADTAHDPPTHEPPRSRTRTWIAGGVAAAVLATGGFFGVDAIPSHTKSVASASARGGPGGGGGFGGAGPGGGGGVFGTIKSIKGSSLVVTTNDGSTETVTTTSGTTATKAVTASLTGVKAGDHVVVIGTGTATIAATSITDSRTDTSTLGPGGGLRGAGPAGANGVGPISGTIADVGSATLTVTETGGTTVKVTTSASTTVTTLQTIGVSDLAIGQSVLVRGTTSNGTFTATAIEEGAMAGGPGGPGGANGA